MLIPTSGLLALRSPLLLVAAPTLGWRFLSGDDHYWSTDWHYSAVLMPVVTLALVDAIDTVRRGDRPLAARVRAPAAHRRARRRARPDATALPTGQARGGRTYEKPDRVTAIERLLAPDPRRGDRGGRHRPV